MPDQATFVPSRVDENSFERAVANAECLLNHATERAIPLRAELIEPVLLAREAVTSRSVGTPVKTNFYEASVKISEALYPVTAETIRNCSSEKVQKLLSRNRVRAVVLTVFIACLSVVSFVNSEISRKLRDDIAEANAIAAKLRGDVPEELAAKYRNQDPCDEAVLTKPLDAEDYRAAKIASDAVELQKLAALLRNIRGNAARLNHFTLNAECDLVGESAGMVDCKSETGTRSSIPLASAVSEKPSPPETAAPSQPGQDGKARVGVAQEVRTDRLRNMVQLTPTLVNPVAELFCKTRTYQDARDFAVHVMEDNSVIFGAISAYVLPILYALLGAYAFLLRSFADTIMKQTYHPSFADSARMIAAIIAGAIVSLFNNFSQGVSLSPLATAFLVGYGVELFFAFLDRVISSASAPRETLPRSIVRS